MTWGFPWAGGHNIFTLAIEQYSTNKEGIVKEIKESNIKIELV